MGILHKCRCYLIGTMQFQDGKGWRDKITPSLEELGIIVFNPYKKPFIDDAKEDDETRKQLSNWMETGDYDLVADRMKIVRNYDLRLRGFHQKRVQK